MSARIDAEKASGATSGPAAATEQFEVTRNACVVCSPLGATIVFAGIERGMTLLHGSQGCATYIRRYTISHFREPLDVASSSFTEESAVFGGAANLRIALANVVKEYKPALVGVATTCLAETIGEDAAAVRRALGLVDGKSAEFGAAVGNGADAPLIVAVSTPSYRGSHREGFRAALRALAEATNPRINKSPPGAEFGKALFSSFSAEPDSASFLSVPAIAVFTAMISPTDIRGIKADIAAFNLDAIFATDYSDTLDGGPWKAHRLLPEGGTPVASLRLMRHAAASLEFGATLSPELSAAAYLEEAHGVPRRAFSLPVGIQATDAFMDALAEISGKPMPRSIEAERARLLDSLVDGHKYVFGKRALLYGDPDFSEALAAFLREIGMIPLFPEGEGRDFAQAEAAARASAANGESIDLVIGNSKGYKTAKKLDVPLVRVGFPVHDRFGGQRLRTLGYGGSQELFDRIVNALIERRQEDSYVGYTYY
ncbi:MAG: nitrogenase component 1 [Treponemataceae bacterium]